MAGIPGICPFYLVGRCLQKNSVRRQFPADGGSCAAKSSQVSSVDREPCRNPNINADAGGSSQRPIKQASPHDGTRKTAVSCVESVGKQHRAEGVPEKASSLIILGWSKGTNATYQSAWKKRCCWCTKQCIDPISYDVCCLVNFLAELLDQGVQQHSINTIRSAISMTHTQVNGLPIGHHPLVNGLMKGVYDCRPPQPRYSTTTWDVDIVVRYIQKLGPNEDLSLKQV